MEATDSNIKLLQEDDSVEEVEEKKEGTISIIADVMAGGWSTFNAGRTDVSSHSSVPHVLRSTTVRL